MPSNLKNQNRMPRPSKDDKKKASPKAKREPQRKRGGGAHHDDDDVDDRGNIRGLIAYSSEEDYESETPEESPAPSGRKGFGFKPRKAAVKAQKKISKKLAREEERRKKRGEETEDEDSEDDEDYENSSGTPPSDEFVEEDEEDESEAEEEEDSEDEDDEEDEEDGKRGGIIFSFGGLGDNQDEWMIPKRHKIKKEPEIVQKFFKLMTTPIETDTIDDHIDQFKTLKPEDQDRMIKALESRPKTKDQPVMFRILNLKTTPEIQANLLSKYNNLQSMEPGSGEYFKMRNWLDKAISLPLGIRKDMPVRVDDGPELCQAFMAKAKKCLDGAIYGQEEAKLQILQFIAGKITNPDARGMSLLLVGPPGIGKTSLIKQGIAKALDWPFQFISLGGDSDATTFTGHQLVYEGSHCGKIVNSLVAAKSMSMVLMFDELDKISTTAKGEEIQNLLIHLTDPTQNSDFEDKYLAGIPLDLSQSMFVFSANDINKIDRVLLDRFVVVELKGYGAKEKLEIAERFLLPEALREVNLAEKVGISKEVVQHILDTYAKEEAGVRELKRCMTQIAQKLNMLRLFNNPDYPFHIKDFNLPFILKKDHVDKFLKERKSSMDESVAHLYT
jgi:MoxR-like ATPase